MTIKRYNHVFETVNDTSKMEDHITGEYVKREDIIKLLQRRIERASSTLDIIAFVSILDEINGD